MRSSCPSRPAPLNRLVRPELGLSGLKGLDRLARPQLRILTYAVEIGLIAALTLGVLGGSRELILADYLKSNEALVSSCSSHLVRLVAAALD